MNSMKGKLPSSRHNDRYDFTRICTDSKFDNPELIKKLDPEQFNLEYYHESGLGEVLFFDCDPQSLGMKMIPVNYTVDDLLSNAGGNRMITAFNVATQAAVEMPFATFVKHYKEQKELYNMLTLDVAATPLNDQLSPPSLLTQIDWKSSSFPDVNLHRTVSFKGANFREYKWFPSVQSGLLISPGGSFTDFHIDYGGSTNFLHMHSGRKIWFFIEPTEDNLVKYEQWMARETNDGVFFGDIVEKCARVTVNAGDSLIGPAGWIHAVFTPCDSIGYGGNFLHSRSVQMQLRIQEGEKRLKLHSKFTYPYWDQCALFLLARIVKECTGRQYCRPLSRDQKMFNMEYVGKLFMEKKGHHRMIISSDYTKEGRCLQEPIWDETDSYKESRELLKKWDDIGAKEEEAGDGIEESKENVVDDGPSYSNGRSIDRADRRLGKTKETIECKKETALESGETKEPSPLKWKDFFVNDKTFFHPLAAGIHTGVGLSGIHREPLSRFEPKMDINKDALRSAIHAKEIGDLELLVVHLQKKVKLDLPEGLTRPNSLLASFCNLLRARRAMVEEEGDFKLPPSILPDEGKVKAAEERKRKRAEKMAMDEGDSDDPDYHDDRVKRRRMKRGTGGEKEAGTSSRAISK